jgi:hypothetical protein
MKTRIATGLTLLLLPAFLIALHGGKTEKRPSDFRDAPRAVEQLSSDPGGGVALPAPTPIAVDSDADKKTAFAKPEEYGPVTLLPGLRADVAKGLLRGLSKAGSLAGTEKYVTIEVQPHKSPDSPLVHVEKCNGGSDRFYLQELPGILHQNRYSKWDPRRLLPVPEAEYLDFEKFGGLLADYARLYVRVGEAQCKNVKP